MDLWIKWIPQDNLDLKHDKLQQFRLCIWILLHDEFYINMD